MIIKSLSRKHASFGQLFNYIQRGAKENAPYIFHNVPFYHDRDGEEIVQCFRDNAKLLSKRRGGNVLYHEILSFKRMEGVSVETYQHRMVDICDQYLATRASKLMGFAKMHVEKDHVHMHIMLTANEIGSSRRYRLSKGKFLEIQKQIELYVLDRYPELEQVAGYTKDTHDKSWSDKEYHLKERTHKPSQKDKHRAFLQKLFAMTSSYEELAKQCQDHDMEFYERGKHTVVVISGRKYRLKTLGVDLDYQTMINRLKKPPLELEVHQDRELEREPTQEPSVPPVEKKPSEVDRRREELSRLRRQQDRSLEQDQDDMDFTR